MVYALAAFQQEDRKRAGNYLSGLDFTGLSTGSEIQNGNFLPINFLASPDYTLSQIL
jgi:hypothetical protein